jgi:hypothetical protein
MKPILLLILLAISVSAQTEVLGIKDWKPIKEMTGPIPNHRGMAIKTYAAKIARDGDIIKLSLRMDLPNGAPVDIFKNVVPPGFDIRSIVRVEGGLKLNCKTLVVKPLGGSATISQITGQKYKTKEPPFKIDSGNILALYFCEQPSAPVTTAPKLKPKPLGNP